MLSVKLNKNRAANLSLEWTLLMLEQINLYTVNPEMHKKVTYDTKM